MHDRNVTRRYRATCFGNYVGERTYVCLLIRTRIIVQWHRLTGGISFFLFRDLTTPLARPAISLFASTCDEYMRKIMWSTRSPVAGHKESSFVQCTRFQVRKFLSDNKIIGGEITRWINPYLTSRKRTCKNKLVEIRIQVALESVTKM